MKTSSRFAAYFAAASISLFAGASQAQPEPAASPAPSAKVESSPAPTAAATRVPSKLLYKPPAGAGNIPTRVSGGARGGGGSDASLLALVPDHAALTTHAQPSLFWFQSKPAKVKLELTLIEPGKAKPLLALKAEQASKSGIRRIKLASYKVELQPEVPYEWVVAIVPDAANRSMDVIAKGTIKRITPPAGLTKDVENMDPLDRAAAYAKAGIWYDALESISNAVDAHPDDASIRAQRASLLKQVGLPEAAAADKK
jgi:uncharacterized protein DUF928